MQKNGTGEHIPPPRPKRKSSQPYPQKANSSGTVGPHGGGSSKGGGDVSKAAKKGGKGSSAGVSTGGMGSMAPSHEANMGRHGSPGAMGAPPPVGSVMQHSGGMSSMGMNGGGPWNVDAGQITEDSELAMCMMHGIAKSKAPQNMLDIDGIAR